MNASILDIMERRDKFCRDRIGTIVAMRGGIVALEHKEAILDEEYIF